MKEKKRKGEERKEKSLPVPVSIPRIVKPANLSVYRTY